MQKEYIENGIYVINLSGDEAFAARCNIEDFATWYDKTYTLAGCSREQFISECEITNLDSDGTFADADELNMSEKEIEQYKTENECCDCIDWNNRKFGQWTSDGENGFSVFASYRTIIRAMLSAGNTFMQPVIVMTTYQ